MGWCAHQAVLESAFAYGLKLPEIAPEEIARLGVEAGIEFDCASLGPITLRRLEPAGAGAGTRTSACLAEAS